MILALAPMDGITDLACRVITKKIFEKHNKNPENQLILRTEFMTSDGYIANPDKVIKHIIHTEYENPLILQIFWWNKKKLLKTALDIEKKYWNKVFWIELNMGCPANNVMKSWWWSALLKDKESSLDIIKTLSENLKLPFSIKSRTGLNEEDKKAQMNFLIEASNFCHMITIHARTLKELYSGNWDRDFIYELKKGANKNCKIIGNGGINSFEEIKSKTKNLDGIMVGQSAIWNPRIFTWYSPSLQEKFETILEHISLLAKFEIFISDLNSQNLWKNKIKPKLKEIESIDIQKNYKKVYYTPLLFRKYLHQYLKNIPNSKELKELCNKTKDFNQSVKNIQDFFSKII